MNKDDFYQGRYKVIRTVEEEKVIDTETNESILRTPSHPTRIVFQFHGVSDSHMFSVWLDTKQTECKNMNIWYIKLNFDRRKFSASYERSILEKCKNLLQAYFDHGGKNPKSFVRNEVNIELQP